MVTTLPALTSSFINSFSTVGVLSGFPAKVPIITGCCFSSPSKNQPTTQVPSTGPNGETPTPEVLADVIGIIGVAHGKSFVGNILISSV